MVEPSFRVGMVGEQEGDHVRRLHHGEDWAPRLSRSEMPMHSLGNCRYRKADCPARINAEPTVEAYLSRSRNDPQ